MKAEIKYRNNKSIVIIEVLNSEIPKEQLKEFVKKLTDNEQVDIEYML